MARSDSDSANSRSPSPKSRRSSPVSTGRSSRSRSVSRSPTRSRSRSARSTSRSVSRSRSRSSSPKKNASGRKEVDPAERARLARTKDQDSEDDDEYESRQSRRKKRKEGVRDFFLDEAEVDDDVEDDEEAWNDGFENDILGGDREEQEAGISAREIEAKMRKDKSKGRLAFPDDKLPDEETIEAYYRNRYNEADAARQRFGQSGEGMSDEITQQQLLPGVKDPNLWMVKCLPGTEKETVLKLMHKVIAHSKTDQPLQIKSVVTPEHVKGYIYIEAFKQTHVKQAIEGVSNLRMGQWSQKMVPIKEMTDVFRVMKVTDSLKKDQWVRLKRGVFKDDLAQVHFVELAQNQVELKLLPRIDYSRKRGALRFGSQANHSDKKNLNKRYASKKFDPALIRQIGGEITNDGDYLLFEGNRYTSQGFLYKRFPMNAILSEGVKPTLTELEKFEKAPEGVAIELSTTTDGSGDSQHSFANGDNVEVIEGELVNLQGKVIGVEGNKVTMMPKHPELKDALEFTAPELRKYFVQGDHVKVLAGRYEGDTGLIVRIQENLIVLFSDVTMHELKVLPRDLQLCSDIATGVDSLGQYSFGEMVQLNAQTVGVIIQIQKENFQILNMHDQVVVLKATALQKKRENRNATALDYNNNPIQRRDIVKVTEGKYVGMQGEIKHLYRVFVFVHSSKMVENGGIFVCKSKHLELAGGSKPKINQQGNTPYMSPRIMSPRIGSPMHNSQTSNTNGGIGGSPGIGRGRVNDRDKKFIGQTVKITQGPYKSHIGIVKDATEATARIELHSDCKTIMVDRSRLAIVGGQSKGSLSTYVRTPSYASATTPGGTQHGRTPMYGSTTPFGGRTPMYGSQTPMHGDTGSRTPHYGSQTPHYGSQTPHYGSQTPAHNSGEDGSKTPGRNGAWDPRQANTPNPMRDYDNFRFDNYTSNYNFGSLGIGGNNTPGQESANSKENKPSSYKTSGTGYSYNQQSVYSPYQPSPSPAADYQVTPSPDGYVPTPSPYQPVPSPDFPSPRLGYSPMTPGHSSSPYSPLSQAGGNNSASIRGAVDWYTPDIEVTIASTYEDSALHGKTGVVRGVTPGMCSLYMSHEERTINVLAEHLMPVKPIRGDKVKVILGDDIEATGYLLSIDELEGVVKMDQSQDVKMLPLNYLCKMKNDG